MVMIGSALAVLQAVWVIVSAGRRRSQLRKLRTISEAREARIVELTDEIRSRWGDEAADIRNLEDMQGFEQDDAREAMRSERDALADMRTEAGWLLTYGNVETGLAPKARELYEVETEWRRLWTQGVPGLLGGLLALAGGILVALGTS